MLMSTRTEEYVPAPLAGWAERRCVMHSMPWYGPTEWRAQPAAAHGRGAAGARLGARRRARDCLPPRRGARLPGEEDRERRLHDRHRRQHAAEGGRAALHDAPLRAPGSQNRSSSSPSWSTSSPPAWSNSNRSRGRASFRDSRGERKSEAPGGRRSFVYAFVYAGGPTGS
jgi:hypothetical protein